MTCQNVPRWAALFRTSRLDHHVFILDADPERLCDIRPFDQLRSLLHRNTVTARLDLFRVAPGLSGADVEFPGVPGAADDLAAADVVVVARLVGQHQAGEVAL